MSARDAFPPVTELLPHRDAMLLIDRILASSEGCTVVEAVLSSAGWYANADGTVPAWIGVELMAQAIAAHASLVAIASGKPPRRGVLLGTRAYTANVPAFPAGDGLTITARTFFQDAASGLAAYHCTITRAETPLAEAEIKVYEPDDFERFILPEPRA
jgi:predicted hotdog family 3-hydroxylacyl-ACP dehydratase